jgi:hypothetical protein
MAANTTGANTTSQQSAKQWKPLVGVYKSFFNTEAYPAVEAWYNTTAKLQDRHHFKELVKEISSFDMALALANRTKATCDPDIALANAIVAQHGGDHLTETSRKRAVEFLSTCHPSKRELYRRTFGLITRPSNLCALRHIEDMNPKNFYVEVDTSLVPKKKIVGAEHLHRKSEMLTLPNNAQTGNRTYYQQQYVWKVGSVPLAYSQRAIDRRDAQLAQQIEDTELLHAVQAHIESGVTTAFVNPLKKKKQPASSPVTAEDHSCEPSKGLFPTVSASAKTPPPDLMPTPWGVLNTGNVDGTQWESVTHDTFKETYFLQPKDQRKFQNLNDNYSRMVYLTRRKLKKDRKAAEAASSTLIAAESSGVSPSAGAARSSGAAGGASPFGLTHQSGASGAYSMPTGKQLFSQTVASAPGSSYALHRSASGPLQRQPLSSWLEEKGRRPVSVVFPSI